MASVFIDAVVKQQYGEVDWILTLFSLSLLYFDLVMIEKSLQMQVNVFFTT